MGKKYKSPHMNRREFTTIMMSFIGSIMGAVVGIPIIGYVISPAIKTRKTDDWVSMGPLDTYPIGTPTLFTYTRTVVNGWERSTNSYGAFVIRKSENDMGVFSNICTHLSCRVNWHEDIQQFVCPCHDGRFDINGIVLSGPPPRPLDVFEYKIEDGNILIHVKE